MSAGIDGHLYLPHLFVLARARKNQLGQLLQIRDRRSIFGAYSRYDKDLLRLIQKTRIQYHSLVKRSCLMLSDSYGIENGADFLRDYWSSDLKSIGAEKLGLGVPGV
jgi:hypothetical protein